jgi:hypothetical protein
MDLLTIIILIFLIGWLLGFFVFSIGSFIHILLVVAIVVIIYKLIKRV